MYILPWGALGPRLRGGCRNFGEYIALAEKANIVILGEAAVAGREWISLADAYMGKVFPVFAGP